jgi:outer membrane protein
MLAQEKLSQFIGTYQNEKLAVLTDDFQFQKPYPAQMDAWLTLAQSQNLSIQQARLQQQYADDARRGKSGHLSTD